MKKLSSFLLFLVFIFFINGCDRDEVSITGIDNQLSQIQDHFDQNAFSKTISANYQVNWDNTIRKYSRDFKKDYFEFSISYDDNTNRKKKGFYQVDFKIIAVENDDNSYQFYVAKFLQDLRINSQLKTTEEISFSDTEEFTGLIHLLDSQNDIVYAKWLEDGESKDGKLFLDKDLDSPSFEKRVEETCTIGLVYHYKDWYTRLEDGSLLHTGTQFIGVSTQELCDSQWLPDIDPTGGNGAGSYNGTNSNNNSIYNEDCEDPIHGCQIELEVEETEILYEGFENKLCQKGVIGQTNTASLSDFGQSINELFETNQEFNLLFKTGNLGPGELAITIPLAQQGQNGFKNIEIIFDNDFLNNGTKLMMAKTAIHEQFHASLVYLHETGMLLDNQTDPEYEELASAYAEYKLNSNLNPLITTTHEMMSSIVTELSEILYEDYGSGIVDYAYCEKLMWGGLQNTTAFEEKYPQKLENNDDNPEYVDLIKTLLAEANNQDKSYIDDNGNLVTILPKGEPCNN